MNFRTDLAIESGEYREKKRLDGVLSREKNEKGIRVTTIEIINEKGEALLKKPVGKYITVETVAFDKGDDSFSDILEVLCRELSALLPERGSVLVAGLGNEDITPDALGPEALSQLFATRHISRELKSRLGLEGLRSVAGIVPGVLGKTGVETVEIIGALVEKIKPDCVVVIDALASRSVSRLGTTVQMTDTGISPGSGVGNSRKEISEKTLGVPVVAIGVPTVVDALTMALDVFEAEGIELTEKEVSAKLEGHSQMMVTPKEIDSLISKMAGLIALTINCVLQPQLTAEELISLVM